MKLLPCACKHALLYAEDVLCIVLGTLTGICNFLPSGVRQMIPSSVKTHPILSPKFLKCILSSMLFYVELSFWLFKRSFKMYRCVWTFFCFPKLNSHYLCWSSPKPDSKTLGKRFNFLHLVSETTLNSRENSFLFNKKILTVLLCYMWPS